MNKTTLFFSLDSIINQLNDCSKNVRINTIKPCQSAGSLIKSYGLYSYKLPLPFSKRYEGKDFVNINFQEIVTFAKYSDNAALSDTIYQSLSKLVMYKIQDKVSLITPILRNHLKRKIYVLPSHYLDALFSDAHILNGMLDMFQGLSMTDVTDKMWYESLISWSPQAELRVYDDTVFFGDLSLAYDHVRVMVSTSLRRALFFSSTDNMIEHFSNNMGFCAYHNMQSTSVPHYFVYPSFDILRLHVLIAFVETVRRTDDYLNGIDYTDRPNEGLVTNVDTHIYQFCSLFGSCGFHLPMHTFTDYNAFISDVTDVVKEFYDLAPAPMGDDLLPYDPDLYNHIKPYELDVTYNYRLLEINRENYFLVSDYLTVEKARFANDKAVAQAPPGARALSRIRGMRIDDDDFNWSEVPVCSESSLVPGQIVCKLTDFGIAVNNILSHDCAVIIDRKVPKTSNFYDEFVYHRMFKYSQTPYKSLRCGKSVSKTVSHLPFSEPADGESYPWKFPKDTDIRAQRLVHAGLTMSKCLRQEHEGQLLRLFEGFPPFVLYETQIATNFLSMGPKNVDLYAFSDMLILFHYMNIIATDTYADLDPKGITIMIHSLEPSQLAAAVRKSDGIVAQVGYGAPVPAYHLETDQILPGHRSVTIWNIAQGSLESMHNSLMTVIARRNAGTIYINLPHVWQDIVPFLRTSGLPYQFIKSSAAPFPAHIILAINEPHSRLSLPLYNDFDPLFMRMVNLCTSSAYHTAKHMFPAGYSHKPVVLSGYARYTDRRMKYLLSAASKSEIALTGDEKGTVQYIASLVATDLFYFSTMGNERYGDLHSVLRGSTGAIIPTHMSTHKVNLYEYLLQTSVNKFVDDVYAMAEEALPERKRLLILDIGGRSPEQYFPLNIRQICDYHIVDLCDLGPHEYFRVKDYDGTPMVFDTNLSVEDNLKPILAKISRPNHQVGIIFRNSIYAIYAPSNGRISNIITELNNWNSLNPDLPLFANWFGPSDNSRPVIIPSLHASSVYVDNFVPRNFMRISAYPSNDVYYEAAGNGKYHVDGTTALVMMEIEGGNVGPADIVVVNVLSLLTQGVGG